MLVAGLLENELRDNHAILVGQRSECTILLNDSITHLDRATRFVRKVEERVNQAIKNGKDLILRFGEEFEFSRDQKFLRTSGEGFGQSFSIETGNIIGTVRDRVDGNTFRFCITSRFGAHFLHRMIASSEGFLELEDLRSAADSGDAEWLLWFLWKIRVKSAFAAGIPKLYANRAGFLPIVRGNLDLNALLGLPKNTSKYPCRYREHSYDNAITRLVNATFHHLSKRGGQADMLLSDMAPVRSAFREACADERRRDRQGEARGIRNPYFAAYEEVANLSRRILADAGAAISSEDDDFSALLFDVSLLFAKSCTRIAVRQESRGCLAVRSQEVPQLA
jgi:McrBC 5-methylcytosine restriction system component